MQASIFSSESGPPSLRFGAEALEDPVDPVEGARCFASKEQIERGDHVIVFGAGLGYRLQRLHELGCEEPIVFEPHPEAIELAKAHGPGIPAGAVIFTNAGEFHGYLLEVSKKDDNTILLAPPAYQRAFPEAYTTLCKTIEEVQGLVMIRHNSVSERSALLTERAVSNLHRLAEIPTIDQLGRPLEGMPAFIVSAGPSLDRNRHLLPAAAERGAVFAVNTSAPVFAAIGAPIDVLVAIEALDVSEPIALAAPVTRALALDLTAGAPNYETPVERKTIFCVGAPQYMSLAADLGIETLGYGGSVATAAFALAIRLGANPIVVVGQDTAYTDLRGYANDTLYEKTVVRREEGVLLIDRVAKQLAVMSSCGLKAPTKARPCVDVKAWGGGLVPTTHELISFRRWFEMAARVLDGDVRCVNATEGGASIEGFEEIALEALLAEFPVRAHDLHERLANASVIESAKLRQITRGIAQHSHKLARAAERCAKATGKRRGANAALTEALRTAAQKAPLAESHAASRLSKLREEEDVSAADFELKTYRAIQRSASRISAEAKRAEKRLKS